MSMNQNQKSYLIAIVTGYDEHALDVRYTFGFPDGEQARDFVAKAKAIPDSEHLTWDIFQAVVYPSDCADAALDQVRKDIEEEGL